MNALGGRFSQIRSRNYSDSSSMFVAPQYSLRLASRCPYMAMMAYALTSPHRHKTHLSHPHASPACTPVLSRSRMLHPYRLQQMLCHRCSLGNGRERNIRCVHHLSRSTDSYSEDSGPGQWRLVNGMRYSKHRLPYLTDGV